VGLKNFVSTLCLGVAVSSCGTVMHESEQLDEAAIRLKASISECKNSIPREAKKLTDLCENVSKQAALLLNSKDSAIPPVNPNDLQMCKNEMNTKNPWADRSDDTGKMIVDDFAKCILDSATENPFQADDHVTVFPKNTDDEVLYEVICKSRLRHELIVPQVGVRGVYEDLEELLEMKKPDETNWDVYSRRRRSFRQDDN